jgi:hypothetical protein
MTELARNLVGSRLQHRNVGGTRLGWHVSSHITDRSIAKENDSVSNTPRMTGFA